MITIDPHTRTQLVDVLKRGTITRNRMCWEHAPCTWSIIHPIVLDDEAAYAIDTVLRVLARSGYRIAKDEAQS